MAKESSSETLIKGKNNHQHPSSATLKTKKITKVEALPAPVENNDSDGSEPEVFDFWIANGIAYRFYLGSASH